MVLFIHLYNFRTSKVWYLVIKCWLVLERIWHNGINESSHLNETIIKCLLSILSYKLQRKKLEYILNYTDLKLIESEHTVEKKRILIYDKCMNMKVTLSNEIIQVQSENILEFCTCEALILSISRHSWVQESGSHSLLNGRVFPF